MPETYHSNWVQYSWLFKSLLECFDIWFIQGLWPIWHNLFTNSLPSLEWNYNLLHFYSGLSSFTFHSSQLLIMDICQWSFGLVYLFHSLIILIFYLLNFIGPNNVIIFIGLLMGLHISWGFRISKLPHDMDGSNNLYTSFMVHYWPWAPCRKKFWMGLRVRIYYGIVVQYPLWLYLFIWVSTSKYQTHSTMASSYKEGSMAIYLWLGLKDLFILLLQKVTHKLGWSMFPTQTEWIH